MLSYNQGQTGWRNILFDYGIVLFVNLSLFVNLPSDPTVEMFLLKTFQEHKVIQKCKRKHKGTQENMQIGTEASALGVTDNSKIFAA